MSSKGQTSQVGRTPNEKMHEALPLGDNPIRPSNNKTAFYTDEVLICDGAVKLLRTKQSNKIWQMRVWIRDENRYFKKSLRTKS